MDDLWIQVKMVTIKLRKRGSGMLNQSESMHGMWSSRLMFIFAAAGSAVGLGNIWRFPYLAGENGGGVFVLAYLGCIALIGIPILVAEILLGRAGRQRFRGARPAAGPRQDAGGVRCGTGRARTIAARGRQVRAELIAARIEAMVAR